MINNEKEIESKKSLPLWTRNKYLVLMNDWATKSTCFDGLPSIGRSEEWYWKLIWLIIFFGMTGYCGYSLGLSILDYYNYDVNTEITIKRQASIEFPTVNHIKLL